MPSWKSDQPQSWQLTSSSDNDLRASEEDQHFRPRHSVANSLASATTAATSVGSSGNRSITSTFSCLAPQDVQFFDEVVASLAPGEASFAALRRAYDQRDGLTRDADVGSSGGDDHRWNILLSLVKVRGHDWSERWDAVRIALGMEMRIADDPTATFTQTSDQTATLDGFAQARGIGAEAFTDEPTQSSQWTQETSQSEGSDADGSNQTTSQEQTSSDDDWLSSTRRGVQTSSSGATAKATGTGSTRPADDWASVRTGTRNRGDEGPGVRDLRAKMEALSRQASQLAIAAGQREHNRAQNHAEAQSPPPFPSREPRESHIRGHLRMTGEGSAGRDLRTALASYGGTMTASERTRKGPQQRIDNLIQACRLSRESIRDAVSRRAEETEEARWDGSARLAQQHYENRLLSLSWGWWASRRESIDDLSARVSTARAKVLLDRSWKHWHAAALGDQQAQEVARRADTVRTLLSSWRTWRRKKAAVTTQKWELRKSDMRESYAAVKFKRHRSALETSWQRWRATLSARRCDNFRNGHLLGGAFYLWRIRFDVSSSLSGPEVELRLRREQHVQRATFASWRQSALTQRIYREWQLAQSSATLRQTFAGWKQSATLSSLARTYDTLRLQRSTLQAWLQRRHALANEQRRQSKAQRMLEHTDKLRGWAVWRRALHAQRSRSRVAAGFDAARKSRNLSEAFSRWRLRTKLHSLVRARDDQLKRRTLETWRARRVSVTITLGLKVDFITSKSAQKLAHHCLRVWYTVFSRRRDNRELALSFANSRASHDILRQWQARLLHVRAASTQASLSHEHRLTSHYWQRLRSSLRERRLERFQATQSKRVLQRVTLFWRQTTAQHTLNRLHVATLQSQADDRITRASLQRWMNRVIEQKALLLQVAEAHDEQIVVGTLQRWRAKNQGIAEMQSLGRSFQDVKKQELSRRALFTWLYRFRKARSLRERSDRFVATRAKKTLASALTQWHGAWRESDLRPLEVQLVTQRQESVKYQALMAWIAKTKPIPALHFHHTRVKAAALAKWRAALPLAIDTRTAADAYALSTSRKAFSHWNDKWKARRGARAAARFGGPSMGARLRRHSSRTVSPFVVVVRARKSGASSDKISRESSPALADAPEADAALNSAANSAAFTLPRQRDINGASYVGGQPSPQTLRPQSVAGRFQRAEGRPHVYRGTGAVASTGTFSDTHSSRGARSEVLTRGAWPRSRLGDEADSRSVGEGSGFGDAGVDETPTAHVLSLRRRDSIRSEGAPRDALRSDGHRDNRPNTALGPSEVIVGSRTVLDRSRLGAAGRPRSVMSEYASPLNDRRYRGAGLARRHG